MSQNDFMLQETDHEKLAARLKSLGEEFENACKRNRDFYALECGRRFYAFLKIHKDVFRISEEQLKAGIKQLDEFCESIITISEKKKNLVEKQNKAKALEDKILKNLFDNIYPTNH